MVTKCLEKTKEKPHIYKSIAIPAIGTGVHRYPADVAATATFDAISNFCNNNVASMLESIRVVIFPDAPDAVKQVFYSSREITYVYLLRLVIFCYLIDSATIIQVFGQFGVLESSVFRQTIIHVLFNW